jgi:hypothetical protein
LRPYIGFGRPSIFELPHGAARVFRAPPTPGRRLRSLRPAYSSLADALSPMRFGGGPLRLAFGTSWLSHAALVIPDRVADHMEMNVGPAF